MDAFIDLPASCVAALMLFFAWSGQGRQSQRSVSELVKSSMDAAVLVIVSGENERPIVEGSGFIVPSDGKIVTNHHVVSPAHSALAKLNDGTVFGVEGVRADDPEHDIALIKVAGENLPFLALMDSDSMSVGNHPLTIGSSLGLEKSVSGGIVSATTDSYGRDWIRAAAAALRGNSGGALLTTNGGVAGILILSASEGKNFDFAVSRSRMTPFLAKSLLEPVGNTSTLDSPASPRVTGESIWTSMTDGRDYKVRIDGEYIYAEWVNLPQALKSSTAFSRSELKKHGDKWIGHTTAYMPFDYQHDVTKTIWCRVQADIEIDKVSASRIEGQSQLPTSFNAKKCQPENLEWKPFTWIPK